MTTFFFFAAGGTSPYAFTTPECTPTLASRRLFVRSSAFWASSTSALTRLNVWKSSSSAPASRPVPRSTVVAATSAHNS